MDRIIRIILLALIFLFVTSPLYATAQGPLKTLQQNIENGIRVLEDPRYQDTSRKQEQQKRLYEIMLQTYDLRLFSRLVIGRHWHRFSQSQKNEFVKVFSEFLGKYYLGKLQKGYSGQRINFLGQQIISTSKALVEVEVTWLKLKIPVKMYLSNRSGKWKVYNLSVLGISAVRNYRVQFNWILNRESPQQAIARLKNKIAKLDRKSQLDT
ncbi:MAG: ABC transporter substrate-binding protein [Desulfobacterales bacterium]|nr:ABC transporter substrate-binding protein [Desulfobacterales bacterium]